MKIEAAKNILFDIFEQDNSVDFESYFINLADKNDLIAQIIFELIKEQYYANLPQSSLRAYATNISQNYSDTFDASYEQLKRNRAVAATAQNELYRQLGIMPTQTNGFKSKAKGYQYNSLQIHQINNYQNLEIIKSLMKGRMADSKKVSRIHFREIFQEYDRYVCAQMKKAEKSSEECLACSIDFYDLQIRMKIELTYCMASYMEKYQIHNYPNLQASFFINGFYRERFALQNRFLLKQPTWLKYIFNNEQNFTKCIIRSLFQLLYTKKCTIDIFHTCIPCCDFETNDMVDFVRKEYNPFSIFQDNKDWNNRRIDIARKILKPFWIGTE